MCQERNDKETASERFCFENENDNFDELNFDGNQSLMNSSKDILRLNAYELNQSLNLSNTNYILNSASDTTSHTSAIDR